MDRYRHQVLNPADCTTFYKCHKDYLSINNYRYKANLMKCPQTKGFDQNSGDCIDLTSRKLPRCYKGKQLPLFLAVFSSYLVES